MSYSTLVDVSTLRNHLDDPDWVVFDCRFDLADIASGRRAYTQAHIPNAVYGHIDDNLSSPIAPTTGRHPLPDTDKLIRWLGVSGIDQAKQVVVYDASGGAMAVRLWWLLRWLGHTAVALLDGGWPAWQKSNLGVTADITHPNPTTFNGTPDWSQVLSSNDVLANLASSEWLLIDARTAERHRGESEPIDPIAGRIPGSVNMPLQHHLNAEGQFLSAPELRALYDPLLVGHEPRRTACYCGSGVTACHNLLAMEIAGLGGGCLYAGSWSEWIRDPSRPRTP